MVQSVNDLQHYQHQAIAQTISNKVNLRSLSEWVSEWVIIFNGLSGDSGQRGPYTVKCRYKAVFGVQEIDRVIAVTAL